MKLPKITTMLTIAVFLFIVAELSFALYEEIYGRRITLLSLLDKNRNELEKIKNENSRLEEQIVFYKSKKGLEYLALKDYNMVSKDTMLYRITIKK